MIENMSRLSRMSLLTDRDGEPVKPEPVDKYKVLAESIVQLVEKIDAIERRIEHLETAHCRLG